MSLVKNAEFKKKKVERPKLKVIKFGYADNVIIHSTEKEKEKDIHKDKTILSATRNSKASKPIKTKQKMAGDDYSALPLVKRGKFKGFYDDRLLRCVSCETMKHKCVKLNCYCNYLPIVCSPLSKQVYLQDVYLQSGNRSDSNNGSNPAAVESNDGIKVISNDDILHLDCTENKLSETGSVAMTDISQHEHLLSRMRSKFGEKIENDYLRIKIKPRPVKKVGKIEEVEVVATSITTTAILKNKLNHRLKTFKHGEKASVKNCY